MVIHPGAVAVAEVHWPRAVKIVRDAQPPIDLFEDIADPEDWPLIISALKKTNPRLMETIGNLDLVPAARRVAGPGASYLMAPFTHVSRDRASRFSDGSFGVLHAGDGFEVALFETLHHHGLFLARTREPPGWTSRFLEIFLDIEARLHDLRTDVVAYAAALAPNRYADSQALAASLRAAGSDGLVYPSRRWSGGDCVGLFYPDRAGAVAAGRRLDYHWDGARVDLWRDLAGGAVFRIA